MKLFSFLKFFFFFRIIISWNILLSSITIKNTKNKKKKENKNDTKISIKNI
jgi:hypothetical protein